MANITVEVCEVRYEDYANNNHKFYRAYLWGDRGLTQWGRIGARGQFKLLTRQAARRKIEEKRSEGYEFTTPWMGFEVPDTLARRCTINDAIAYQELANKANEVIGMRVAPAPLAPAKTQDELEEELAQKLLAMQNKYAPKPTPEATPEPTPEPEADPTSIEGRLGAALKAARANG